MGGGDLAGDMAGVVGTGLTVAMGAVAVGAAGKIMTDAAKQIGGKKKKRGKKKSGFSINI